MSLSGIVQMAGSVGAGERTSGGPGSRDVAWLQVPVPMPFPAQLLVARCFTLPISVPCPSWCILLSDLMPPCSIYSSLDRFIHKPSPRPCTLLVPSDDKNFTHSLEIAICFCQGLSAKSQPRQDIKVETCLDYIWGWGVIAKVLGGMRQANEFHL